MIAKEKNRGMGGSRGAQKQSIRYEHNLVLKIKENQSEIMRYSNIYILYQCRSQRGGHQFQQRRRVEEHKGSSMKETSIL